MGAESTNTFGKMLLKMGNGKSIASIAGVLMKARTVLNQLRANLSVPALLNVNHRKHAITSVLKSGNKNIHIVKL
jgi:hypothetical protein